MTRGNLMEKETTMLLLVLAVSFGISFIFLFGGLDPFLAFLTCNNLRA